jgi:hypothetical protein
MRGWNKSVFVWSLIGDRWTRLELWRHERWVEKNERLQVKWKRLYEQGKSKLCYSCFLRRGKSRRYRRRRKCRDCGTELISSLRYNEIVPIANKRHNDFIYEGLDWYYDVRPKDALVEFFKQELVKS